MRKQFRLKIQFEDGVEENQWWNGASLDPLSKPGQRFYCSEKEAKSALNRLMNKFNKAHIYDASRIVNWCIQAREVSEWAVVESNR